MTTGVGIRIRGFKLLERRLTKFMQEPASIRIAASVIVTATAITVGISGVLMRVIDHKEFHNIWIGLWWAVQTVTTVGYGDITPKNLGGRLVAVVVMLEGTALITIVTAAITSTFINRARVASDTGGAEQLEADRGAVDARFDDMTTRLDRIEALLRDKSAGSA
jgi:voltage-gated potassium channel